MYIDEYNEYLNSYDDLIKMGDLREYMVQEFVIRSFLQKIMPELDIKYQIMKSYKMILRRKIENRPLN